LIASKLRLPITEVNNSCCEPIANTARRSLSCQVSRIFTLYS
jgi:hypothetical protein